VAVIEIIELYNTLKKLAPDLANQNFSDPDFITVSANINKLGVCVDPTAKNIKIADELGIEVLISYHPWYGEAKEYVENRMFHIWPLHEAWDNVAQGVTFTFAKGIGLNNLYTKGELIFGELETSFHDLIERCQHILGQNILSYSGDLNQPVLKIALWAGPGFLPNYKKFWEVCLSEKCDTILSSELTLSALRYSRTNQLKMVDLGHSSIAKPGMVNLTTILKELMPDCGIHFLDDFYTCTFYTNCSFAEQFTESEDIFFETDG
jgi:putative NIF3 family GTP cyclohydrolase 1 type 2